jgi:tetratricopeptide (TPR) repeat protein
LHFRRALDLDRKAFGESDHQTAMVKAHLAQVLIKLNRYPEAEPLLEQSLSSLEDRAPKGNMSVSVIEVLLGQVLVRLGRFREAEPKLLAGFAVLKDQRAQPLLKSREDALENLALVSLASGRPSQARDYRSQMLTRTR